jgi:sugar phosphate isomerase/epimerase
MYMPAEIAQIAAWLAAFGLQLNDLHASDGEEKKWVSSREYERRAGVELVRNRIAMTAELGGDVIVMHLGDEPKERKAQTAFWTQLRRSLGELEPFAGEHGVQIAVENGEFGSIRRVLEEYGPDYVGLCYDCGHGNLIPDGLDDLDALKDRLLAVHLHDNDGRSDQHKLLFSGTVDWPRLAGIIAVSSYRKPVSMEVSMRNSGIPDEAAFLQKAFQTGTTFAKMISRHAGTR